MTKNVNLFSTGICYFGLRRDHLKRSHNILCVKSQEFIVRLTHLNLKMCEIC
jgi:hypothetical protein